MSNKVFSYLNNNAEETFNLLDQLETLPDNELVEAILNTSENALDEVFEKITYKKLVELINNISDEQAQKLVHYILPEHFEKLMQFIPVDKLNTYMDTTLSLEKLTEQELKKLSDEDISDEQLENIIILAGEEKLAENFDIIPNKNLVRIMSHISNDKLAPIISHASDESLVRIIDIIDSDNHDLSKSLVGQIIALIHDKKCVKQESGAVSDSDSGFFDYEDEIKVSDNQVEYSNSDFTMKLSYNFGVFNYEDDVVYL
ncbi:Unknown [Rickettsia africae ESF-5]|uniref:Magnesium transporter MgtE intracellular domain-containing protein n=1 Tax=Rickettsia africae (strain ESF-5) TaxID=347255 RepID=C3PNX0_RICAE|nr:Unknown [Rickettsia africae ESF-5]